MERKIQWSSGCLDEIELVYDRAAENEAAANILYNLEVGALGEAKANYWMVRPQDSSHSAERYDALPEYVKEQTIAALGMEGLTRFYATVTKPEIVVQLSPLVQKLRCCTAFSILNRLEKLDGAINTIFPKVTLKIQVPLGCKHGLAQIEMLIVLIYPWLKVCEISSCSASENLLHRQASAPSDVPEANNSVTSQSQSESVKGKKKARYGFLARILKKKNKLSPVAQNTCSADKQQMPAERLYGGMHSNISSQKADNKPYSSVQNMGSAAQQQSPNEKFYCEMSSKASFQKALKRAKLEISSVIDKNQFGLKSPSGSEMTVSEWEKLSESQQLKYILSLGYHGITPSILLCIDFVEIVPYCLAITLLYLAYTGQCEAQLLDTGDNSDATVLDSAIHLLSDCWEKWSCRILT